MKIIFPAFIFILFFFSCNDDRNPAYKVDSLEKKEQAIIDSSPEQTVKDFLCWYSDNFKKIGNINMVRNNPPVDDTLLWYAVNFDSTQKWLNLLKESGFVSDEFVAHWKKYFKDCEKNFQKDHVSDGPPEGFDYDFIFNSQEEFLSKDAIRKAEIKLQPTSSDKVTLILSIPGYGDLTKKLLRSADGKWLMAE